MMGLTSSRPKPILACECTGGWDHKWNHQHLSIFTYPKDEIITGKRLQKTMERSTHLEIGTSTISTGPFSMSQSVTNYQRVITGMVFQNMNNLGFPPIHLGKCHGVRWEIQLPRWMPPVASLSWHALSWGSSMVGGVIPNLAYPLAISYIAIENGSLTIDLHWFT